MSAEEQKLSVRCCERCGGELSPGGGCARCADRPLMEMLRIALPSVVTMTSYTVMQFIDAKMVAHIDPPSPIYIAAQGNGMVAAWLPISFMFGVLTVVNTFVSQHLGAGRAERGPAYGWTALWLSAAWALVLVPYGLAIPWVFGSAWVGHGPELVAMESAYAQIMIFGAFLTIGTRGLSNYFYGMHKAGVVMLAAVVANGANVFLNAVLIFGPEGMPRTGIGAIDAVGEGAASLSGLLGMDGQGVRGAALATVLGTGVELAIPVLVFLGPSMNRRYGTRRAVKPDRRAIRDVLRLGWPGGLMMFNELVCWSLLMAFLVPLGGRAGAAARLGVATDAPSAVEAGNIANTAGWIALRYMHLSFMPTIGISIAVTAVVGKCMGMGRPDLAAKRAWLGLRLSLVYMGLCALAFVVFREPLVRFFASGELAPEQVEELVRVGSAVMIAAAVFQLFDATAITFSGALRGAGDTVWPGVATIVLSWVFIVGGGLAMIELWPGLGSIGPWIGASGFIVTLGVAMLVRFVGGPWRRIELVEGREAKGTDPLTEEPARSLEDIEAGRLHEHEDVKREVLGEG